MSRRRALLVFASFAALLIVALAPRSATSTTTALFSAARETLLIGAGSAFLGGAFGGFLAALGALIGGRAEALVTRLTEVAGAIPTVLVVPVITFGSPTNAELRLLLALALVRAAESAHVLRTQVRGLEREGFAQASVAMGSSRGRLLATQFAPHILPHLLITFAAGAANAVGLDVAVSFLGLMPESHGLGAFAAHAFAEGNRAPLLAAAISSSMMILVLVLLAESLRDRLDVRGHAAR